MHTRADDSVENEIVSGLRFLQVVKRSGITGAYELTHQGLY